jgi:hypothetical protein
MTEQHLNLLKASIDQVVALEFTNGERHLAQVLVVFHEGDTPDCFYLRVEQAPDGALVQPASTGFSVLLSEIAAVYPLKA